MDAPSNVHHQLGGWGLSDVDFESLSELPVLFSTSSFSARVIDLPHRFDLGTVELPLSDCLSNTCSSPEMNPPCRLGWSVAVGVDQLPQQNKFYGIAVTIALERFSCRTVSALASWMYADVICIQLHNNRRLTESILSSLGLSCSDHAFQPGWIIESVHVQIKLSRLFEICA